MIHFGYVCQGYFHYESILFFKVNRVVIDSAYISGYYRDGTYLFKPTYNSSGARQMCREFREVALDLI
jgi:hypothetical protein